MEAYRILADRLRRWSNRHILAFAAGVPLVVLDIAGIPGSSSIFFAGGIAAAAYGIFGITRDLMRDRNLIASIYDVSKVFEVGEFEDPYRGWSMTSSGQCQALMDDTTNSRLTSEVPVVSLVQVGDEWKPSGEYEELRQLLALKLDSDELKIRLATDLTPQVSEVRRRNEITNRPSESNDASRVV